MSEEKIMTLKELAEYMKVNEKTVLDLAENKKIPGVKVDDEWTFVAESIDQSLHRDIAVNAPEGDLDSIIETEKEQIPLASLVDESLIEPDMKAADNDALLNELADIAAQGGIVSNRKKLIKQLRKREWMLSTAVGNGVAIPHPRNPNPELFSEPKIVIGRSVEGIDFSAPDKKKVHLFFMICAPNIFAHLRILAKISKLLRNEGVTERILGAADKKEMIALLAENNK
ncbi:MAG: PTS sugar transporter subunit IIA [Candidatus Omnitrophota bacterium]